jgi:hypothetical protein
VQLSAARLVLFSVPIVWNPLVPLAWMLLPHGVAGLGVLLVHLVAYTIGTILLDPVATLLERLPGARRLMGLSRTRGFRRYLAPGFRAKEY